MHGTPGFHLAVFHDRRLCLDELVSSKIWEKISRNNSLQFVLNKRLHFTSDELPHDPVLEKINVYFFGRRVYTSVYKERNYLGLSCTIKTVKETYLFPLFLLSLTFPLFQGFFPWISIALKVQDLKQHPALCGGTMVVIPEMRSLQSFKRSTFILCLRDKVKKNNNFVKIQCESIWLF